MIDLNERVGRFNPNSGFLIHLPFQRIENGFILFELAAREFPLAALNVAGRSLTEQYSVVVPVRYDTECDLYPVQIQLL